MVNCGADSNRKVCRSQLVNKYPAMRLYRPGLSPRKADVGEERRGLLHSGSKRNFTLKKTMLEFSAGSGEYFNNSNPGWRVFWKPLSGQPAPIFDETRSQYFYQMFKRGQYIRKATKSIVYLTHRFEKMIQCVYKFVSGSEIWSFWVKFSAKKSIFQNCPMKRVRRVIRKGNFENKTYSKNLKNDQISEPDTNF